MGSNDRAIVIIGFVTVSLSTGMLVCSGAPWYINLYWAVMSGVVFYVRVVSFSALMDFFERSSQVIHNNHYEITYQEYVNQFPAGMAVERGHETETRTPDGTVRFERRIERLR